MISWSSSTASSTPATSLKVIFGESGAIRLARLLPNDMTLEPPPCTWFMRKIQNPKKRTNGIRYVRIESQAELPVPFESNATSFVCSSSSKAASDWSLG